MSSEAKQTTEHACIKQWVEKRGGHPAIVKSTRKQTQDGETGLIRIDFPGYYGDDALEMISWEEFFRIFEATQLAFLYQEELHDGQESRFCKLVDR